MLLIETKETIRDRHVLEDKITDRRYLASGFGFVPEDMDASCEKARIHLQEIEVSKD